MSRQLPVNYVEASYEVPIPHSTGKTLTVTFSRGSFQARRRNRDLIGATLGEVTDQLTVMEDEARARVEARKAAKAAEEATPVLDEPGEAPPKPTEPNPQPAMLQLQTYGRWSDLTRITVRGISAQTGWRGIPKLLITTKGGNKSTTDATNVLRALSEAEVTDIRARRERIQALEKLTSAASGNVSALFHAHPKVEVRHDQDRDELVAELDGHTFRAATAPELRNRLELHAVARRYPFYVDNYGAENMHVCDTASLDPGRRIVWPTLFETEEAAQDYVKLHRQLYAEQDELKELMASLAFDYSVFQTS